MRQILPGGAVGILSETWKDRRTAAAGSEPLTFRGRLPLGARTTGMRQCDPVLVTGASGYVGSHLIPELLEREHVVRALTRDADGTDLPSAVDVREGDAYSGDGLDAALDGCRTAFYLIHSMGDEGDGDDEDFAARDKQAARNFGEAAKRAGVERVVYLGGLQGQSEHLQSREATAETLAECGPPVVHARAAMVIGAGSDSFEIIRNLVNRLPVLLAPKWVSTRTQPIAVRDAADALVNIAEADDPPAEVELGGPDVLSYGDMMQTYAKVAGKRRRPMVIVPFLGPKLSSYGVAALTPVERGIAWPLIEGLQEETTVTTAPPHGINDAPMSYADSIRVALDG